MTATEDRLTRALEARADQVTPEALTRTAPAEVVTTRRRLLLPALVGVAAAVLVVAVVVVTGQDDDDGDTQPVDRPTVTESSDKPSPSTTAPAPRLPRLLPEDDAREFPEGTTVPFPDGSLGELTATTFTLNFEGYEQTVEVPDYQGAAGAVFQTSIRFGEITGYLLSHTSGDFTSLDVVLDTRDGLVVQSPNLNRVPFGISPPLYDTWTSDHSTGLYTRVRVGGPARNRFEVYRWEPVTLRGDVVLLPESLGIVCFDFDAATYERC